MSRMLSGNMKKEIVFKGISKGILELSEYLLVILMIIDCNTVYRHTLGRPIVPQVWNFMIILECIIIFLKNNNKQVKKYSHKILIIVLYNSLFMALVLIPQSEIMIYTRLFLLFFPLSIVLCLQDINNNQKFNIIFKFENLVLVLAVSSFILWILGSILNVIGPNIERPVTWNNGDIYNGFYGLSFVYKPQYENIPFLNLKVLRNISIFTESPMFNIVLIIGLYTELFLKEKSNIIKLSIISITILSTFGTLGIILMLFGYGLKFLVNNMNRKQNIACISIVIVILILIGILFINKKVNGFGSYSIHLDDYLAGIKAWKTSPLVGTGFNNYEVIRSFMNPTRGSNLGTSNSLTDVMAQGGIMMLAIYLMPFLDLFLQFKKDKNIFLWSLAPLSLFIVTIYHFTFLLFFILALCLADSWSLKENRKI